MPPGWLLSRQVGHHKWFRCCIATERSQSFGILNPLPLEPMGRVWRYKTGDETRSMNLMSTAVIIGSLLVGRFIVAQDLKPRRLWTPPLAVVANRWDAKLAGGILVKLVGVSDCLLGFPDKVWSPNGQMIDGSKSRTDHNRLRRTDPAVRRVFVEIEGGISGSYSRNGLQRTSETQMVFAFIPGIQLDRSDSNLPNGWPGLGIEGSPSSWLAQNANTPIEVVTNRMKVSDMVIGISDGPFTTIDSIPNPLGVGQYPGKDLGNRKWGTAKITVSGARDIETRPEFTEMVIDSKTVPPSDQFLITAFDANNKAIATSSGNRLDVPTAWIKSVKRWEVKARPFQYVLFKGVHFESN